MFLTEKVLREKCFLLRKCWVKSVSYRESPQRKVFLTEKSLRDKCFLLRKVSEKFASYQERSWCKAASSWDNTRSEILRTFLTVFSIETDQKQKRQQTVSRAWLFSVDCTWGLIILGGQRNKISTMRNLFFVKVYLAILNYVNTQQLPLRQGVNIKDDAA